MIQRQSNRVVMAGGIRHARSLHQIQRRYDVEMFGDTIELITVPKDKHKTINGDKKAVTITHQEQFPKEATEWLGYGDELQVRFGKRWCVGKVVGGERRGDGKIRRQSGDTRRPTL